MLTRETQHSIRAFDTETYRGYARLICADDGSYLLEPDAGQMLEFFTRSRWRQAHVFAYNLRFDAQALIKLLPAKNVREIAEKKKTVYQGYTLKYIPRKLLTITDENRHTCRMYDLAQYFETSLDFAAADHLGERKIDFPYRAEMNTDFSIWRDYEPDIITYCQRDAALTARLGGFLQKKFYEAFRVKPQQYISKGSLGKFLVRQRCFIPDIHQIPVGALSGAFYAYKGGRFEAVEKGFFPYCELYDIVSAYPYEIANLIDVSKGEWRLTARLHDDAYYGFYVCRVIVPHARICPIAYVSPQHFLYYPFGEWVTYMTKQEIESYIPFADIEVISGWEYYPEKIVYPFKQHIASLFMKKKHLAKTDYAYDLVKKMMNSVYGAFYEKTRREKKIVTGVLFNPVYATIITANTRIKLFLFAKKHEQDVISMATDSVLFKGKHNIKTSKELGEWGLEGQGETVVLMNGIYEMGEKIKSRGIISKTEAGGSKKMKTDYGEYDNIFDYMRKQPTLSEYPYYSEKPVQMLEAIKSAEKFTIEDINTWQIFKKSVYIDKDFKRLYDEDFSNGGNYFKKSIGSQPRIVI